MSTPDGLIIHFDEEKRNYIINEMKQRNGFSDALSVYDWEMKKLQVVLISFTGTTIDFICLATKGNRVVTAKSRVEFSDLVDLDSIPLDEIKMHLSSNTKLHFMKSSTGHGGRIPHQTWQQVIAAIKKNRPRLVDEIDRLFSLSVASSYKLTGYAAEILTQEREALGTALDIFANGNELRKEVLRYWVPKLDNINNYDDNTMEATLHVPKGEKTSFLSRIPPRYIQEESAIQHDLYNWEGERATLHEMGVSRFEQGNRVLDVIYANKNPLEHTLGVDLIYYNEAYESFILVQYKTMKEKNESVGYYYRPDEQLYKEIIRIDDFHRQTFSDNAFFHHNQFRLNYDGFLFKLVPNKGLQPASEKLIAGMYITREYMKYLLSEHGPKGEQGGKLITFSNSPRYLTNSEFSSMVNRGWIGTSCNKSDILSRLIKTFLSTGKAVLVASETSRRYR